MVYEEAHNIGIHPRQLYSILDIRTIEFKDKANTVRSEKLVRLLDPWAGSVEWQGPCSDYDQTFWT